MGKVSLERQESSSQKLNILVKNKTFEKVLKFDSSPVNFDKGFD